MNWYVEVLRKYATFTGRARRQEYWMFVLVNVLISIVLGVIDGIMSGVANGVSGSSNINITVLGSLYSLLVLVPSLAVGVRRLHDTGRSGWWMLLALVPLVNLLLLVFFIQEGVAGPNEYGPDPKGSVAFAPAAYGAAPAGYGAAPAGYGAAPTVAASAPAGWLSDPTGRHQTRYWDGVRWSEHVSDNGVPGIDPVQA